MRIRHAISPRFATSNLVIAGDADAAGPVTGLELLSSAARSRPNRFHPPRLAPWASLLANPCMMVVTEEHWMLASVQRPLLRSGADVHC